MTDQGLYQMTFTKEPGELDFTFESCRRRALLHGYPGHRGGFWNYLTADIIRLLRKPDASC